jgi:hypothetical protein
VEPLWVDPKTHDPAIRAGCATREGLNGVVGVLAYHANRDAFARSFARAAGGRVKVALSVGML